MLNPATFPIVRSNSITLYGFPDNEDQLRKSLNHGGFGKQCDWRQYAHHIVVGEVDPDEFQAEEGYIRLYPNRNGRVNLRPYPQYFARRSEVKEVQREGATVVLGADCRHLELAIQATLKHNGYLALLCHHDEEREAFELTDDFFTIDDLRRVGQDGGNGMFDLRACRCASSAERIKSALGNRAWVVTSDMDLSVGYWLLHRSHFLKLTTDLPQSFELIESMVQREFNALLLGKEKEKQ